MIKKLILTLSVVGFMCLHAGNYEKGMEALEKGDHEAASSYFEKACNEGHSDGCNLLFVKKDYATELTDTFVKVNDQANKTVPKDSKALTCEDIQMKLANQSINLDTAFELLKPHAENNCVYAQNFLGIAYKGFMTKIGLMSKNIKDAQKSIYWLEKASNAGDLPSQESLSFIYLYGGDFDNSVINKSKGIYWQEMAGKNGSQSQMLLWDIANRYKDKRKFCFWNKKLIDIGDEKAIQNTHLCAKYGY